MGLKTLTSPESGFHPETGVYTRTSFLAAIDDWVLLSSGLRNKELAEDPKHTQIHSTAHFTTTDGHQVTIANIHIQWRGQNKNHYEGLISVAEVDGTILGLDLTKIDRARGISKLTGDADKAERIGVYTAAPGIASGLVFAHEAALAGIAAEGKKPMSVTISNEARYIPARREERARMDYQNVEPSLQRVLQDSYWQEETEDQDGGEGWYRYQYHVKYLRGEGETDIPTLEEYRDQEVRERSRAVRIARNRWTSTASDNKAATHLEERFVTNGPVAPFERGTHYEIDMYDEYGNSQEPHVSLVDAPAVDLGEISRQLQELRNILH